MREIPLHLGVIDQFSFKEEGGWRHSFLSNGFTEPDGTFVEREYQASKTFNTFEQEQIMACTRPFGPLGCKRLGKAATLRPDWNEVKFQIMARLVLSKFLDHTELARELLATADALIIEGNTWHDNTWGDCRCGQPDHPECQLVGLNWLGHILMSVRETLGQL